MELAVGAEDGEQPVAQNADGAAPAAAQKDGALPPAENAGPDAASLADDETPPADPQGNGSV